VPVLTQFRGQTDTMLPSISVVVRKDLKNIQSGKTQLTVSLDYKKPKVIQKEIYENLYTSVTSMVSSCWLSYCFCYYWPRSL